MKIGDQAPDDKDMVYYESKVMVALNFQLLIPKLFVQPHVDSILFMCDKTLEDFIGHDAYKFYTAPTERPPAMREQKISAVDFYPRDYGDIKRTKSSNEMRLNKLYKKSQ